MTCTVKDFVMFGFNFPPNFIDDAFKGHSDMMIKHLNYKFEDAYDRAGARGAMNTFYSSLDSANREMLERYVADYYAR